MKSLRRVRIDSISSYPLPFQPYIDSPFKKRTLKETLLPPWARLRAGSFQGLSARLDFISLLRQVQRDIFSLFMAAPEISIRCDSRAKKDLTFKNGFIIILQVSCKE